jgi:NhaA family Na+:H+ antiporter
VGIFGSVRLAVAIGLAQRPAGASWTQVYAVSMLCGVGFTMSLFIGGLAFEDAALISAMKVGVLSGSFLSAISGYLLFVIAAGPSKAAAARP